MSRDVELPAAYCEAYVPEYPSGVCGNSLPCPIHQSPVFAYCAVPSGIAGVPCGGLLPCSVHGPQPTPRQASASDPEILALAKIVGAIEPLDERTRRRVVNYVIERYSPGRSM